MVVPAATSRPSVRPSPSVSASKGSVPSASSSASSSPSPSLSTEVTAAAKFVVAAASNTIPTPTPPPPPRGWLVLNKPPGPGLGAPAIKPAAQNAAEQRQAAVNHELKKLEKKLDEPNPATGKERQPAECALCMEAEPCMAFPDCGHVATCQNCAPKVADCPFCRTPITKTPLRLFF